MEENTYLKSAILEVVENQLQANDPPETRQAYDRLISEGYSEVEVKKLIGCVVSSEKGSDLLLAHVKNIIEKSSGSNPRFYVDMDFISQ